MDGPHPPATGVHGGPTQLPSARTSESDGFEPSYRDRASPQALVAMIEQHYRQMARLLDGLDDLGRAAASDQASGLSEGCVDVSLLVSFVAGRLRLDDVRLRRLAAELDGRTPLDRAASPRSPERGDSHAHALRPLP